MPAISQSRALEALAWGASLGWLAALVSLCIQFRIGVYDTWDTLWLPLAGLGAVGSLAVVVMNARSLVQRGRHRSAAARMSLTLAPCLMAAGLFGYMVFHVRHGSVPNNEVHKVGRMAAVTAFKTDARLRYPSRMESSRLVMYFDAGVTDPAGDMRAMEEHLVRMEQLLGRQQREPIHYVRGPAFGLRAMSLQSVALSNHVSPATWFDRHELAHSFLYQFYERGTAPPTFLLEGWAMAMDGERDYPASTALVARRTMRASDPEVECLRWILSPERYGWANEPCEAIAPAFVQFVLAQYGGERFIALYNSIRPDRVEEAFRASLGSGLSDVEAMFWKYAESNTVIERATKAVDDWVFFLRTEEVSPDQRALNDREVKLLGALTVEERVELVQRRIPARLDELARVSGLPAAECERRLRFVADQLASVLRSVDPK